MSKTTAASLPLHVPAKASVARRSAFAGPLPIARLPRLAEALPDSPAVLEVRLQAGTDSGGASQLSGTVTGEVELTCQRCLRLFQHSLRVAIDLRLVENEADEARLLHECEPYQVIGDRLPLHDLVEDEVLLALPLSPKCGQADCASAMQ